MVLEVRGLAALGFDYRLDVLGPLPSGFKDGPADAGSAEVNQLQLSLFELPQFVWFAELLDFRFHHSKLKRHRAGQVLLFIHTERKARPEGFKPTTRSKVFEEPSMGFADPPCLEGKMAVVIRKPRPNSRDVFCQPLAMSEWHESVMSSMPQQQRDLDL